MIDELLPLIGTYGFPIFIALWFMYRMEKILANNTQAINDVNLALKELCGKIVGDKD